MAALGGGRLGAALGAARVTTGTRLLDTGCGAGLLARRASLRGALVSALEASAGPLAMARPGPGRPPTPRPRPACQ
jgi:2-polyprenyl-3-methyl-5-hydroxy-6-metoxy-1,4-benzoquinol methylase